MDYNWNWQFDPYSSGYYGYDGYTWMSGDYFSDDPDGWGWDWRFRNRFFFPFFPFFPFFFFNRFFW